MHRCEALVMYSHGKYVPCGLEDAQLHHKLTRARGGLILDRAGETYHQMWLCAEHHGIAHDQPAFDNGLLLRGSVRTNHLGQPVYTGPDEYLKEHYPS